MTVDSSVASSTRPDSFREGAIGAIKVRGFKYAGVSVVNVVLTAILLSIFYRLLSASDAALPEVSRFLRGAAANTAAVVLASIPAYYLSRAYVWGKRGRSELRREVLPFWILVFAGLVVSTLAVGLVAHFFPASRDVGILHPAKLAANVANLVAFGVLWVIRFFWMDKAFHLDQHHAHGPLDVLLDEDEPVEPDAGGAGVSGPRD